MDLALHGMRTFTSLLYIGFSPAIRVATFVGEQITTAQALGLEGTALGIKRMNTEQGRAILKKYQAFVGRGSWEEFKAPGKELPARLMDGLFGLFHTATVTANKEFLMGSLTDEEYKSGEISTERLAAMRVELGRWRAVPGSASLVGSTSAGKAVTQFKSWAVPVLRTALSDIGKVASDLRNKPTGEALTTKEARELVRIVAISAPVLIAGAMLHGEEDDEDRSFMGELTVRMYKEGLTLLQGLKPTTWLAYPIIAKWLVDFGKMVENILTAEEYESTGELKGVEGAKRLFIPRQFRSTEEE